ncbi:MAG: hypothetical protein IPM54_10540 [Polyangiaceae bacterium]|nr:hypothetical protein [Polyangiaceae bacterium]
MKRRRKKLPMPSDEEAIEFLAKTPSFVILCETCTAGYAMRITFEQFEKCMADAQQDERKALDAIFDIENFDEFYAKNPETLSDMATFCEQHQGHKLQLKVVPPLWRH